jgi:hypothetical protein
VAVARAGVACASVGGRQPESVHADHADSSGRAGVAVGVAGRAGGRAEEEPAHAAPAVRDGRPRAQVAGHVAPQAGVVRQVIGGLAGCAGQSAGAQEAGRGAGPALAVVEVEGG